MFFLLALGYAAGSYSYMGSYGSFSPTTMVQASIRVDQIEDTLSSLRWLNGAAPAGSYLVMDERFLSFAELSLDENIRIVVQPGGPPTQWTVERVLEMKPAALFAIWDSELGLGGLEVVHSANGIFVFQFDPSVQ